MYWRSVLWTLPLYKLTLRGAGWGGGYGETRWTQALGAGARLKAEGSGAFLTSAEPKGFFSSEK